MASPLSSSGQAFDPERAWRSVLDELKLSLDAGVFHSYVRDAWLIAYEDGEFIIGLPSVFAYEWLHQKLLNTIKKKLRVHLGRSSVQVTLRVQSPKTIEGDDELASTPLYQAANERIPGSDGAGQWAQGGASPATQQERSVPMAFRSRYTSQLRAEYTFDAFVVGDQNRLAHAAASAIAQEPGARYNPFFIYGGVGLGKTHLLHAIGNYAQAHGSIVLYCSSEQFTNDLINSIRSQKTDEFRDKYRQVDVLLIDDIQFLDGKERTQEEFFHTFNHLHAAGGQVVLSSDRPPKALGGLEERLRSRFEGGLQADIQPPDFETRVAILQKKANRLGVPIDPQVLMFVAERIDTNIRELEGALNRLHIQSQMSNQPLTYDLAVQLMDNLAPQRKPCSPDGVVRIVALHFNLTPEELTGRGRSQPVAHARHVAMYLLRAENGLSYPRIGRVLGGRDHSTIRHGVTKMEKDIAEDNGLRAEIARLRDRIYLPYAK
jgi:chromosomal replication initiator protein